jgi:hypothetical protein
MMMIHCLFDDASALDADNTVFLLHISFSSITGWSLILITTPHTVNISQEMDQPPDRSAGMAVQDKKKKKMKEGRTQECQEDSTGQELAGK